jgi:hypothetical protein
MLVLFEPGLLTRLFNLGALRRLSIHSTLICHPGVVYPWLWTLGYSPMVHFGAWLSDILEFHFMILTIETRVKATQWLNVNNPGSQPGVGNATAAFIPEWGEGIWHMDLPVKHHFSARLHLIFYKT